MSGRCVAMKLSDFLKAVFRGYSGPREKLEERKKVKNVLPVEFTQGMQLDSVKALWMNARIDDYAEAFNIALNNWRQKKQSSFALVGFKNQGKSLVLDRLLSSQKAIAIHCREKVITPDDLEKLFSPLDPDLRAGQLRHDHRRIVSVDDGQNMFLRHVNGFAALNTFLRLMSNTWERIFWVTAWERTAWFYLDGIMNISKFFTSVVYLKPLQGRELERVISGLSDDLQFRLQYPEEYFHLLVKENRGLLAACLHWLLEGAVAAGEREIRLELANFRVEGLNDLNEREAYALAGLLQNDCLTAGQMAMVINEDEMVCEQVLAKLHRLGLCTVRGKVYCLNSAFLPQVLSFLDKQRFLYVPV